MQSLIQITIGSFLLSIVHALIPNHWIPLVAISRTEKWEKSETLIITAITGFSHTVSTIIIGIVVGLIGYELSSSYSLITSTVAPTILVLLGLIYILLDFNHHRKNHHGHAHIDVESVKSKGGKTAIILSLCIAMFFSPCLEIEAYYFVASASGWVGIIIVSVMFILVTISAMLLLVSVGLKGMEKIKINLLEHHDKLLTGGVLIILGMFGYFVDL